MKKSAKNCTLYHVVNKSVWADIGAASTSSTNILVLLVLAAPIGEDTQTFYNFKNFADFLNVCSTNILCKLVCSTNILAQYKENENVCSTTPIPLNIAYSVSWSKRKWK
jgi:hypothetical protein